jgi:hypothetical protein
MKLLWYLTRVRVTLRNGSSIISTDFTEDTIDNYYNDAYLVYCQTIWQLFWALQDKHNIHTLSVSIHLSCTRC